ncbi:FAD-binding protein [Candidatus Nitronereus thalassa]|uniref:FAD-binding protein n=1 Tax=Candidatus Nitronereus thalassa TaxID=3020898 RepID=A0ABU3K6N2_9BACT|nr:FAD-binding protein [Candidatus Nitronereus thalassa]MDT7042005.1 FAD-binding protein [Candidatus Nitronereus thalassa]
MGLFKKKSAAEKQRKAEIKKAKKDARADKKDARQDSREVKKTARKDAKAEKKDLRQETKAVKKDARQDKREGLKDVRQSDLTGKAKRDAKKDVRKGKKDTVKVAKQEKKDKRHDIRNEKKDRVQDAKVEKKETIQQIRERKRAILKNLRVPKALDRKWNSYLKFQHVDALEIYKPNTLSHLQTICRIATDNGLKVRAIGSGHSFSEIGVTEDIFVETKNLNKMLPMNNTRKNKLKNNVRRRRMAELQVGRTIIEISKELEKSGEALINQGTYDGQTFWGAVSTSTHGSGLKRGPFPAMILSLVLVGEGGRTYRIEPRDGITEARNWRENGIDELIQNDDVFNSVICSFGCMGIVYSAVISTREFYWMNEWTYISTWSAFKESFSRYSDMRAFVERWDTISLLIGPTKAKSGGKDGVSFKGENPMAMNLRLETNETRTIGGTFMDSLTKFFERIGVIDWIKAPAEGRGFTVADIFPGDAWIAKKGVRASGKIGWMGEEIKPKETPIKRRNKCYKIFPKGGKLFGGYGLEVAFPIERTIEIMDRIIELAEENKSNKLFHTAPVAVRFVAPTTAYASPQYADPNDNVSAFDQGTVMFEVLMAKGTEGGMQALQLIEEAMLDERDVRVHWGLHFDRINSRNTNFERMYPKWPQFRATFQRFNRQGTFKNVFTDRIGLR